VHQELEHERAAEYLVSPRAAVAALADPALPEAARGVEAAFRLVAAGEDERLLAVEAEDKRWARVKVAESVVAAIEAGLTARNLPVPPPSSV